MEHRNSLILATVLLVAATSFAGTWMASPGKGSHASAGPPAAFRSLSWVAYGGPRTNTTVTAPTGIIDGDTLLLVFIIAGASPPTPTLPSGFTTIQGPSTVTDSGFSIIRRLAWKRASGESGDYDILHSSASTQGIMICISGAANTTPVSSNNSGTGSTTTATGITTPSNGSVVTYIAHNWDLYGAAAVPGGTTPTFTERSDEATSLIYVATGVLDTAGATGDKTQGNLNTGAFPWAAFLVATGP